MSNFPENAIIIISAIEHGALDLAARIGLEAESLTFPVVITDQDALPPGRFPIFIGQNNKLIPPGLTLPALIEGEGALLSIENDQGLIIWGKEPPGETLACRWAASTWPGALPQRLQKITKEDYNPCSVKWHAGQSSQNLSDWPRKEKWECLGQTYTVKGLLGSTDGLFPDKTNINFKFTADISIKNFALLCDVAARIGLESNGMVFPLAGHGEKIIEVSPEGDPGWIRLDKNRLLIHAGQGLDLSLQYLARDMPDLPGEPEWLTWDITALRDLLEHENPPPGNIIWQKDWQVKSEYNRFIEIWEKDILPQLLKQSGLIKSFSVDLRVSLPEKERIALGEIISNSLKDHSLPHDKIVIRPVFKQAYYWLTEEVLPRIKASSPDLIKISFQLLQEKNIADLPIRWLQEIYPADEVIRKATGANVKIMEDTAQDADPLSVKAYRGGKLIWNEEFKPSYASRPLLDGYGESGYVYHPTGSITITDQSRGTVLTQRLYTDLELFWQWYSRELLPEIENNVEHQEPLFGTLSVKYYGSEPETRTGIREEVISPLEALHQDIYFTSLDRFAALGNRVRGKPFTAPGAIIPHIINQPGSKARAQVTLTAPEAPVNKVTPVTGIKPGTTFKIIANGKTFSWVPPTIAADKGLDFTGKPLFPQAVENLLARIKKPAKPVKVKVSIKGRSIEGRAIYAVEMLHCPGERSSPARAGLLRPTMLLNGRHHGNEVSSTTAIFDLINRLAGSDNLLKKVNLVAIPMENVDGAALHHELATDNPNWKLHAARFNRHGYDFYQDYFKPERICNEANALSRLWQSWLPDLVLDAHGVPSHEWVQYFSGFNSSSRFPVSYWLPNSLFYGILFEPVHIKNKELGTLLGKKIALSMKKDAKIESANKERLNSYKTYGHNYCPTLFPLTFIDGLIFFRHDANKGMTFTERHPMITITQLITEVADETATGSYLELCARAHLKSQIAALTWLSKLPLQIEKDLFSIDDQHIFLRFRRIRAQEL